MSNDLPQPESDADNADSNTQSNETEGTEVDLWDLDFYETKSTNTPRVPHPTSTVLPSRRDGEFSSNTKLPTGKQISVPALPKEMIDRSESPLHRSREKSESKISAITIPASAAETEKNATQKSALDSEKTQDSTPKSESEIKTSSFTKTEKLATLLLFAVLLLTATLGVIYFSNRIPTRPAIAKEIKFPVNGKLVEIKAVNTYWREPITSGENTDIVRRGTKLIPVIKISLHAKPCAVRIFFRNEDDIVIGDGITREISGDVELTIPATAGFDDIGMHAAYRTKESEPWIVQIFEGPNRAASSDKFDKVLETEISTDVR